MDRKDLYGLMMMAPVSLMEEMRDGAPYNTELDYRIGEFREGLTLLAYEEPVDLDSVRLFLIKHSAEYGESFVPLYEMGLPLAENVISFVREERERFRKNHH